MKEFKGRKISQFHLDFINTILDEIISGAINTTEALELLKEVCINNNETIIKDRGTIKRCVMILLKDRPNDLELYQKNTIHNSGKRNSRKGKIGKPQLGFYHKEEKKFKQHIIEYYLPQILEGTTTFNIMQQELKCSHHTIDEIILEYYSKNKDEKGLQEYQSAKKRNYGVSLEKRQEAKDKRKIISNYDIVSSQEFLLLTSKEQEVQLIMKIRTEQLKEELSKSSKTSSAVTSEEVIKAKIQRIMDYFKTKNTLDEKYFSDEEIRVMIFSYPTLINRTNEKLDEKINALISYREIDEKTAYGMIKTFPGLMGYDASRIKKQLDILTKENIVDAVVSTPRRFMLSIDLMYALIQYAKERHKTSDLIGINRNNIFMANSTMKRIYNTTHNDIKRKYPYMENEEQIIEYTIPAVTIVKGTYKSRNKSQEAEDALNDALAKLENEGEIK